MNQQTRQEIINSYKKQREDGNILVGVGAGTGITAKSSEKGGADMLIIYNSGRYRMAGRGSLAGLLSYGDANKIVTEMAAEVLPVVKDTPVEWGWIGDQRARGGSAEKRVGAVKWSGGELDRRLSLSPGK